MEINQHAQKDGIQFLFTSSAHQHISKPAEAFRVSAEMPEANQNAVHRDGTLEGGIESVPCKSELYRELTEKLSGCSEDRASC